MLEAKRRAKIVPMHRHRESSSIIAQSTPPTKDTRLVGRSAESASMPLGIVDRLRSICVDHATLPSSHTRVTVAHSTLAIIGFFDASNVAPVVLIFEAQSGPLLCGAAPVLTELPRATGSWPRWRLGPWAKSRVCAASRSFSPALSAGRRRGGAGATRPGAPACSPRRCPEASCG